ncbi:MAG: AAA family ATPase [Bacteroidia bacterium]|nr:AAA family ATPase [Bacteroidia bacterium]
MKIQFGKEYKSFPKGFSCEINDFSIITGENGSGKTNFLKAIEEGVATIDGITIDHFKKNIQYFSYYSFNTRGNQDGYSFYISNDIPLNSLWNEYLAWQQGKEMKDYQIEHFQEIAQELDINVNDLKETDFKSVPFIRNTDDIKLFDLTFFEDSARYIQDRERNKFNHFLNNEYNETNLVYSETEFLKKYGNPPWDFINEMLGKVGLKYRFKLPRLKGNRKVIYPTLFDSSINLEIDVNDLSSGEQILLSLVAFIYNRTILNELPEVILFDEPDALLHPSFSKQFLDFITGILIEDLNIKVILATHSPATIALSNEDNIYVINKSGSGLQKIEKQTKKVAFEIITQKFASLTIEEAEFGLFYNIGKTNKPIIFTEGITDKIILEHSWKVLFGDEDMPFIIQDSFGVSFLSNLFQRADDNQNGLFALYPNKTFIALLDFDKEGYSCWNGFRKKRKEDITVWKNINSDPSLCLALQHHNHKGYLLLLPVPEEQKIKNQVIKSGKQTYEDKSFLTIELLFYGIKKLSSYYRTEGLPGGGEIIKFQKSKMKFAREIERMKNPENFRNFRPLFEKLIELAGAN